MLCRKIVLMFMASVSCLAHISPAVNLEFPIFYTGQVDTFEPGTRLFVDRNHTLSDAVPLELKGMYFIRSHWSGLAFRSLQSGTFYVLVRADRPVLRAEMLMMGFQETEISDFQMYGTAPAGSVAVYRKTVKQGEEVVVSTHYGIFLSSDEITLKPPVISSRTETLYNGIVLPADPRARTDLLSYGYGAVPVPYLENPPRVIPVDVGRQLFVDDFLIDNTTLTRIFHKPRKYEGNPIMSAETAVEKKGLIAAAVPKSGGIWWDPQDQIFKMWYEAGWLSHMAYAASPDGIRWERPNSGATQILLPAFRPDSTTVFLDHDAQRPDERFKLFLRGPGGAMGPAYVSTSPDGINWKNPIPTGDLGDRSSMFYNPFRKKWVYSIRAAGRYPTPHGRARYYREHDDFIEGADWFDTDLVFWACADDLDLPDTEIGDKAQLYNLDAVAYESLMIGFHQIHLGPHNRVCAEQGIPKITELKLSYSRDGFHWHRPDREVFIAAERREGVWDRGYVQSVGGLCAVVGDELWFYYIGFRGDPDKTITDTTSSDWIYYTGMHADGATGIAVLRRDGFASMDAGSSPGVLTTRPLTFSNGRHLFVNINNPSGRLDAEVLDENGTVIDGFARKDCKSIAADSTIERVRWADGKNLADLQGRAVRFRFYLTQGQLYSFWVSPDDSGASYGYTAGGGPGFTAGIDTVGRPARTAANKFHLNK